MIFKYHKKSPLLGNPQGWLFPILFFFLFSTQVLANVINVPADQPTIQAGIDASSDGDTVLVQPGTYVENINFNGKNIVVGSLFLTNQDTSYISQTIIDGNQAGSVVTFENGENLNAALIGYTITNGFVENGWGGGIKIGDSANDKMAAPTLQHLFIKNNYADTGGGIGINNWNVNNPENPTIEDCTIKNNSANYGAGLRSESEQGTLFIINTKFANNQANTKGGAVIAGNGHKVVIRGCVLVNNYAGENGSAVFSDGANFVLINTTISNNTGDSGTNFGSGSIFFERASLEIYNSIFWGNSINDIQLSSDHNNNLITIQNSDIQKGLSSLKGQWDQNWLLGNIDTDPFFVDSINDDYHLSNYSLCISAGTDSVQIDGTWYYSPTTDIDGNPRPNPAGSNPDMGAYENPLAEPIQFIESVYPTQNALNVRQNTDISVTFGTEIEPATINDTTFVVHASQTGLHTGVYSYNSGTKTATFDPSNEFAAGENVSVTLTTGIQSSDGFPIIPFQWSFTVETIGGSGEFQIAGNYFVGDNPSSITAGDFNGDGYLDLAVANYSSNIVTILINDGSGSHSQSSMINVLSNPNSLVTGDFNSDGDLDLAVTHMGPDNVLILINDGTGIFSQAETLVVGSNPFSVTAGDFNSDGYFDLAVIKIDYVSIFTNDGNGSFFHTSDINVTDYSTSQSTIVVGDFDGDGYLDLAIVLDNPDGVSILINDGYGSFTQASTIAVGTASSIIEGDFDYDGDLDLIVKNYSSNLSFLMNDSIGTFTAQSIDLEDQPNSVVSGDWDGDGYLDLFVTSAASSFLFSILMNDGSGVFNYRSYVDHGQGEGTKIVSGDFDSDGDLDVCVVHPIEGAVSILSNIDIFSTRIYISDAVEQSDTVLINYSISNPENNSTNILCEYSTNDGTTWSPTAVIGDTTDIAPENYQGFILWDSYTDLPGVDINTVQFKITPYDQNGFGRSDSTDAFHLDNNRIPSIEITPIEGEQKEDITVIFDLSDSEDDTLGLLCEYYDPSTETWQTASVSGDTSAITNYSGQVTWNSLSDLPTAYGEYLFRITPYDNDSGKSDTVAILLDQLGLPVAESISQYQTEQSGDVTVDFSLSDDENDTVDILLEYSVDSGNNWSAATVAGLTTDLLPAQYNGSITWSSLTDLPGIDKSTIKLKLTPRDRNTGFPVETEDFHLDNNLIPTIQIDEVTSVQTDSINIYFILSDAESDTLSVHVEFKLPDSTSWNEATIFGTVSGVDHNLYSGVIGWASFQDVPDYYGNVDVRITPCDLDEGDADTVSIFVDNVYTTITLDDYTDEQSDSVIINYRIYNLIGTPVNLNIKYSIDSGLSWSTPTVIGDTTGIDSTSYSGSIIWNSFSDLPHYEGNTVRMKVTPYENKIGFPDETNDFHLDNNIPPSITITSLSETLSVKSDISFSLSDDEADTISFIGQYSIGNSQWNDATLTGQMTDITQSGYSGVLNWSIIEDVGFQRLTEVQFILTPFDLDQGLSDTVKGITILNYAGDYTGDLEITTDDLVQFAAAWNSEPQNVIYEIGPATGTAPDLVPQPDGILDFEDLAVFIQMWNWSFEYNGFDNRRMLARINSDNPTILTFNITEPADKWSSHGKTSVVLQSDNDDLLQVEWILEYSRSDVTVNVKEGNYFEAKYQTSPFLTKVSADSSMTLFCVTGLGSSGNKTDGTMIADITISNRSTASQPVTIYYRAWNKSGEIVESSQTELNIDSFIPAEFSLQQNYPNPFNPITTIRYALPENTDVRLIVYDILGREVTTLVNETQIAGYKSVQWNGQNESGMNVGAGMYLCRLQAGKYNKVMKMVLLK